MDVRLTVEFHHLMMHNETGAMEWQLKKTVMDQALPIKQAPNSYNGEVLHIMQVTDIGRNRIMQLLGIQFLALDWNVEEQRLMVFDTFKDQTELKDPIRYYLIAASNNTEYLVLYSHEANSLVSVYRDKTRES